MPSRARFVLRCAALLLSLGLFNCMPGLLVLPFIQEEETIPKQYDLGTGCFSHKSVVIIPLKREDNYESYYNSPHGQTIARHIASFLSQNVKNVDILSPACAAPYLKEHPEPTEADWAQIAKNCKADFVIYGTIHKFTVSDKGYIGALRGTLEGSLYVYSAKNGSIWDFNKRTLYPAPTRMGFEPPSSVGRNETIGRTLALFSVQAAQNFYDYTRRKRMDEAPGTPRP